MFYEREPRRLDAINALVGGGLSGRTDGVDIDYKDKTPPSESAIDTKLAEMQAEFIAHKYQRDRASNYLPIGDQLDMIYKDMKNGTSTHADAIATIKTKWPKDNSGPV